MTLYEYVKNGKLQHILIRKNEELSPSVLYDVGGVWLEDNSIGSFKTSQGCYILLNETANILFFLKEGGPKICPTLGDFII